MSSAQPGATCRRPDRRADPGARTVSRSERPWTGCVELLDRVGIPRARSGPARLSHEFSGGMRQRVMIAMALSCSPEILIADEPTTALDVTTQAQILTELDIPLRQTWASLLLVTHDFGVVADMADRVVVMYGGRVVEEAPVTELFEDPHTPLHLGAAGVGTPGRPSTLRATTYDRRFGAVTASSPKGMSFRTTLPASVRALLRCAAARCPGGRSARAPRSVLVGPR